MGNYLYKLLGLHVEDFDRCRLAAHNDQSVVQLIVSPGATIQADLVLIN